MKYPIAIFKDPESDYGVVFPDLPGCISAGSTMDEAIESAKEAVECHLEGMILDNDPIPAAGSIENHKSDPDNQDAVWALVEVDLSKLNVKSKRVNITIAETLLKTVDKYAKNRGETRSGLLALAVTEYMSAHANESDTRGQ